MNILVIKVGALGDVVRTSFLAQALKDKYKSSNPKIFWLTDAKAEPLFINNPYIYKVINTAEKEKISNLSFELIVNLEEDEEDCQFASSLKHKSLVGFYYNNKKVVPSPEIKEWYNMSAIGPKPQNNLLKKSNKKTHRQLMAEIIGVNFQDYEPFLRLTNMQRDFANNFLRRYNLSRKDLIIGINTGSADRWPKSLSVKKTAALIDKIYNKFNAKVLLFGGPNEIERNKEILKLSKSPVIDTGCGNDLIEFPALISVCTIFITTDSLGLHIALALKRKTISLIGPTSFSEIDMSGLGEKIAADSICLCCYKGDCKSMEKLNIEKVILSIQRLLMQRITLVITAFKEPKTIGKAIESALNQKTSFKYDILVSSPDKETLDISKKYALKDKRVKLFKDPGKGKMNTLNILFDKINSDILILTDGDVYIGENSVQEIMSLFSDPEIGCITGRPIPVEDKKTKFGYWANFLFDSAHNLRKKAYEKNQFIECSGYLFAFRKNKVIKIPLDTAEDTIIPYHFWQLGYKIGYADKAEVFVKNVDNWKDWVKQKTRTSKAHETLEKYVDVKTTPRVKSFKTEFKGLFSLIIYPRSIKQVYWSLLLAISRLYMWILVFFHSKLKNNEKIDNWERIESTK